MSECVSECVWGTQARMQLGRGIMLGMDFMVTSDVIEVPTLGALSPRGGPVQDPVPTVSDT